MTHPDPAPLPEHGTPATPDLPAWPAPTAELPFAVDTLSTDVPTGAGRRPRPARIIAAAAVVLALLVGVGAYAATKLGGGKRPEEFTPATVLAFAGVDLAASLEQQVKLFKLSKDLPAGGVHDGKGLVESLLKQLHLDGVDVQRDIMSWLGKRVAISLLPNGKKDPYALISATTTDDGKAADGLKRLAGSVHDVNLGFDIRDGGALIVVGEGDAQAAAKAAADEAARNPLSKSGAFHDAVRRLDDNQLITVWADLTGIGTLAKSVDEKDSVDLTGTFVLGVRATTTGLEGRYHLIDAGPSAVPAGGDALAKLAKLPADTQVALAATLPSTLADTLGKNPLLGGPSGAVGLLSLLGSGMFGDIDAGGGTALGKPTLTDAENNELEKLLSKDPAKLTAAERARVKELTGYEPFDPSDVPASKLTPAESRELEKLLKKENLTDAEQQRATELLMKSGPGTSMLDPGDGDGTGGGALDGPDADPQKLLAALSGASLTVAASHLGGSASEAGVRISAETTSAANARTLADLGDLLVSSDSTQNATAEGKTVTITFGTYAAGSGTLGDQPAFQQATAGGPANPDVAIYADLTTIAKSGKGDASPVKSVAILQGTQDGTVSGLLRMTLS